MRVLKFRIYDASIKAMLTPSCISEFGKAYVEDRDYENGISFSGDIMQFTGLLDRHGKEIFEGDICLCRMNGIDSHIEEVETEVIYDLTVGAFGHKVTSKHSDYTFFGLNSKNLLSCELIGNIYGEIYL